MIISPREIRDRARKLWVTGHPLRAIIEPAGSESAPFFPCSIPFRKPTAQEWLEHFAELRASVVALEENSKAQNGAGYTIAIREGAHQKLGRLRVPERITVDTIEDLAACAGETAALEHFRRLAQLVASREPRLIPWLGEKPFEALSGETSIPRLLDITAHFQVHPRPNRYARELGIPGVDTKFIEDNRSILSQWLDRLLPPEAIDPAARGLADHGFERRYGLRFEEPQIRFRWLDTTRALASITDATVPISQFAAYAPTCETVIITENVTNFLTLPHRIQALAIFGRGYAVELVRSIPWLANQPLHYWGDLDTHGFAILSRLRNHFPHTRSFLMDHETLIAHRDLWTEELSATRSLQDLPHLRPEEQSLYDDLRDDRLGDRVRLEQERIPYPIVEAAIKQL